MLTPAIIGDLLVGAKTIRDVRGVECRDFDGEPWRWLYAVVWAIRHTGAEPTDERVLGCMERNGCPIDASLLAALREEAIGRMD